MKNENLSFNEIYEILNQLNNSFKIMIKKDIIHYDIKLSNILLRLNSINKIILKVSDYGKSQLFKNKPNNIKRFNFF